MRSHSLRVVLSRRMGAVGLAWLVSVPPSGLSAAELFGRITTAGTAVPGAQITATKGETRVVTTSNAEGVYTFGDVADGVWTIRVEMRGFAPLVKDITVPIADAAPPLELTLLSFADIAPSLPAPPSPASPARSRASTALAGRVQPPRPAAPTPRVAAADTGDDSPFGASDGFLINGSVNNGAASPFALPRAFGNSRPGQRSLFNGNAAFVGDTSAWDARPYSFTSGAPPKPDYTDAQFNGTFGGPVKVPGLRTRLNLFVGGQRSRTNGTTAESVLMPTARERTGDFSQSLDGQGQPLRVVDPRTGQPFAGGRIPADRLSREAQALLAYYPLPNTAGSPGFNFQAPLLTRTRQDSVQTRLSQALSNGQQIVGAVSYNRGSTDTPNVFGLVDRGHTDALDATVNFSRRLSRSTFLRSRYQLSRSSTGLDPAFGGRTNVSGLAGIRGNDQTPENWGPPTLAFANGLAGLATGQFADNALTTHLAGGELFGARGRHSLTYGGLVRRTALDILSQQNGRGTFTFTGAATGAAFADFLLGLPQTSAIALGNPDKFLRANGAEVYWNDDWRVSASLTLNVGLRWEYEGPMTETGGRLSNLALAPDFSTSRLVVAGAAPAETGPGPVRPDRQGLQPRLGLAWRPVAGSSLIVRAGYGLYRNTNVYQSIALQLAQQPPFSRTATVASTPAQPLTLADGFAAAATSAFTTFAVDPDFRVSYAENWQASIQRDLPAALTVTATYLGSRGHRLMQQSLPNSAAPGAAAPCATCPSGFVYLASTGRSLRNAAHLQVRRRLRDGLTANVQYTLSKATDDAAAFTTVSLSGAAIAQDWRNLEAEYARSSFDQRHLLVAQLQYTTGAGVSGGTLVDGLKGRLLKDWTMVMQLSSGSGLPLTPVYLVPIQGTGVTGAVRGSLTGAPVGEAGEGRYLNPAAYAPPAAGEWGTAGRNSVSGPAQYALSAGIGRTFRMGPRVNLDWRFDATNVLNQVVFSGVNTLVGSPQFGLPNRANQMRRLQSSARLRF